MRITGEMGTLTWEPKCISYANKLDFNTEVHTNTVDRNFMFMEEAKHFLEVVKGAKPICTLHNGIDVMKLLQLSTMSSDAIDKVWVDCSE
jgi:hypothetical protein